MVVGRKNQYGSRSKRGTEIAALFYTLIESAKSCGVEPKAYLLHATHAALENPGPSLSRTHGCPPDGAPIPKRPDSSRPAGPVGTREY